MWPHDPNEVLWELGSSETFQDFRGEWVGIGACFWKFFKWSFVRGAAVACLDLGWRLEVPIWDGCSRVLIWGMVNKVLIQNKAAGARSRTYFWCPDLGQK